MEGQVPDEKKEKGSRDDHQTHFTFGSDIQRYPNSEQVTIIQRMWHRDFFPNIIETEFYMCQTEGGG